MSEPFGIHAIFSMYSGGVETILPDGRRVRAVLKPYPGNRLRAAWWVLTGRAYALRWPKPGELELALREPS